MSSRILYVGANGERGPLETALFRHSTRLEAPTVEAISASELCDVAAEANDVGAVIVEHDLGSTTAFLSPNRFGTTARISPSFCIRAR